MNNIKNQKRYIKIKLEVSSQNHHKLSKALNNTSSQIFTQKNKNVKL